MLSFFDCNASYGPRGIVYPCSFYNMIDLLDRMDRYGIEKALVYHASAKEYNAEYGNMKLMEELKGQNRLYPVWIVMPHHTGEFDNPDVLVKRMKEHSVKAVRMFPSPSEQNFCLSSWNCEELLSTLDKHKIPFFIDMDQITWDGLYEICKTYRGIPVILTKVNYRINRNLYPILERCENLYVETTGYKVNCGIEELCKGFGAGRLIFGSGMPLYSGASAVTIINYAQIEENEKVMIAEKNIQTILGGVEL